MIHKYKELKKTCTLPKSKPLRVKVITKKIKTVGWTTCRYHLIRDFYLEHEECLYFNKKNKKTPNLNIGKGIE